MRFYVILMVLFLILIIGIGYSDSTPLSTYTDVQERPAYLDRYADKIAQGYAVFNANGDGLYNLNSVIYFFSDTPQADPSDRPDFLGVISLTTEGDPIIYEVTYNRQEGRYMVRIDASHDAFGAGSPTPIRHRVYEHAALIPGMIRGQACVLYNGDRPAFDNPNDWDESKALALVSVP